MHPLIKNLMAATATALIFLSWTDSRRGTQFHCFCIKCMLIHVCVVTSKRMTVLMSVTNSKKGVRKLIILNYIFILTVNFPVSKQTERV